MAVDSSPGRVSDVDESVAEATRSRMDQKEQKEEGGIPTARYCREEEQPSPPTKKKLD